MSDEFKMHPGAVEAIRIFITSDAWELFFKPAMEGMKEEWSKTMMDPSKARKEKTPDDYIRGCFETLDVILRLPETLVKEEDAKAERREREQAELHAYEERVATGYVGPNFDTGTTPER